MGDPTEPGYPPNTWETFATWWVRECEHIHAAYLYRWKLHPEAADLLGIPRSDPRVRRPTAGPLTVVDN